MWARVVLATVPLIATACSAAEPPGPIPDRLVAGELSGPTENEVPRHGLANVRPAEWEAVHIAPDGRTLTVSYVGGRSPCGLLDSVEVEELPDRIVITVLLGHQAGAIDESATCPDIGVLRATKVTLSRRLGDRRAVDGAVGTSVNCQKEEGFIPYPQTKYVCGESPPG